MPQRRMEAIHIATCLSLVILVGVIVVQTKMLTELTSKNEQLTQILVENSVQVLSRHP